MSDDLFADLGLHTSFCRTVAKLGFKQPSEIQSAAIPKVLAGEDVLAIAQTGTGKTAAFGLPLLQNITAFKKGRAKPRCPRSLILAPTRELALQIHEELSKLCAGSNLYLACVIGGVNQNPQVKKLRAGVDVLIAAPGRLLDLMNQGHITLDETSFLVLDECDRLLDMGFIPDVRRIIGAMPKQRQSLLFSATMPKDIVRFANEVLDHPARIDVSPKEVTVAKIEQYAIMVSNAQKRAALESLLREEQMHRAIIFTRTKHGANKVCRQLNSSGFVAEVIHGNKTQAARQRALQSFKHGDAWILVATDIAARGIDIDDVSHVINYELPHEPESYVHRIGRTGRAGAAGIAWALIDPAEKSRLRAIERLIKRTLKPLELNLPKIDRSSAQTEQPSKRVAKSGADNKTRQRKPRAGGQNTSVNKKSSGRRANQGRKHKSSEHGNEHNDNSGPSTSMRAEAQGTAQQPTPKKRRSRPNKRRENPNHTKQEHNAKGGHARQDADNSNNQGGQRPPRRRRRNVA
tara:strand:- start:85 stop:1638 length:1554 start_codon:yes stop_codon:yes gene_type:complete